MKRLLLRSLNIEIPEEPPPDPDPPPDPPDPGGEGDVLLSHITYEGGVTSPPSGTFEGKRYNFSDSEGGAYYDPVTDRLYFPAHEGDDPYIFNASLPAFNPANFASRSFSAYSSVTINRVDHPANGTETLQLSRWPAHPKPNRVNNRQMVRLDPPIGGRDLMVSVASFYATESNSQHCGGIFLTKFNSSDPDAAVGLFKIAEFASNQSAYALGKIPAGFQAMFNGHKYFCGGYINQGTSASSMGPVFIGFDPPADPGSTPVLEVPDTTAQCSYTKYMGFAGSTNPLARYAPSVPFWAPAYQDQPAGWREQTRSQGMAFIDTGTTAAIVVFVSRPMGDPGSYIHSPNSSGEPTGDAGAHAWGLEMELSGADLSDAGFGGHHWKRSKSTGYHGGPMQWELHFFRPSDVAAGAGSDEANRSVLPYMVVPLNRTVFSGLRGGSATGKSELRTNVGVQQFYDSAHSPIAVPFRIPGNLSEPLAFSLQYANGKLYLWEIGAGGNNNAQWVLHRFNVSAA